MDLRDMVRESDPDRYFSSLFAPAAVRRDLVALYAFDLEIASLRSRVKEPMAGEIRVRWWSDALAAPAAERSGHPVADELKAAIHRHALPLAAFETYLDARIFDLYDDPIETRRDFEGFCGETAGLVLQLACLMLDRDRAQEAADACGHGACLATIDRMLRDPARMKALIPDEVLGAIGADRAVLAAQVPAAARAAMEALGLEHRAAFLAALRDVPATLKPAFIHLAPASRMLGATASLLRRQWWMLSRAVRPNAAN